MLVTPVAHVVLGGDPDLAANVAAGLGLEAAMLVATVTGGGLHVLSYGLGLGRQDDPGGLEEPDGDAGRLTLPAQDPEGAHEPDAGEGQSSSRSRRELVTRWMVGVGFTMVAGWRAAGWQGDVEADRLIAAVTYPAWLFALVGTFLWWSRRTRHHIPVVMAALSIVVAWGHFVIASARSAQGEPTPSESVRPAETSDKDTARFQELRRRLELEAVRNDSRSDSTP